MKPYVGFGHLVTAPCWLCGRTTEVRNRTFSGDGYYCEPCVNSVPRSGPIDWNRYMRERTANIALWADFDKNRPALLEMWGKKAGVP